MVFVSVQSPRLPRQSPVQVWVPVAAPRTGVDLAEPCRGLGRGRARGTSALPLSGCACQQLGEHKVPIQRQAAALLDADRALIIRAVWI